MKSRGASRLLIPLLLLFQIGEIFWKLLEIFLLINVSLLDTQEFLLIQSRFKVTIDRIHSIEVMSQELVGR